MNRHAPIFSSLWTKNSGVFRFFVLRLLLFWGEGAVCGWVLKTWQQFSMLSFCEIRSRALKSKPTVNNWSQTHWFFRWSAQSEVTGSYPGRRCSEYLYNFTVVICWRLAHLWSYFFWIKNTKTRLASPISKLVHLIVPRVPNEEAELLAQWSLCS